MIKNTIPANQRVLLIDDEPYIIEMLAFEMKERGVECLTSNDGKMALELIERERPAVIVSDYIMPGLNGIELLRHLRNINANIPVVWITGNTDESAMREAWRLGVFHLFQKPFNPAEVANEVFNAIIVGQEIQQETQSKSFADSNKFIQKVHLDIERDLYLQLRERCLAKSLSLNSYISSLLRNSL